MSDGDIDRSTMRANLLEQKLFRLELAGIETSKKTVDVDTRKTQYDMKRRLKKYRERQRTILQAKAAASSLSMEELINKQLSERMARNNRPKTSIPYTSSKEHEELDDELEGDRSAFTDQHRSKVDLRPKTARTLNGERFSKFINVGRIGRVCEETRYFDEDELKDRAFLYTKMIEIRKKKEQKESTELKSKVLEFCGIDESKRKSNQQRWKSSAMPINVVSRLSQSRPRTPERQSSQSNFNGGKGFQNKTNWRQSKSANSRDSISVQSRPSTVSSSNNVSRLNLKQYSL